MSELSSGDPASHRVPGASEKVGPREFPLLDFKAVVAAAKADILQIKCELAQTQGAFALMYQHGRICPFSELEGKPVESLHPYALTNLEMVVGSIQQGSSHGKT